MQPLSATLKPKHLQASHPACNLKSFRVNRRRKDACLCRHSQPISCIIHSIVLIPHNSISASVTPPCAIGWKHAITSWRHQMTNAGNSHAAEHAFQACYIFLSGSRLWSRLLCLPSVSLCLILWRFRSLTLITSFPAARWFKGRSTTTSR